eukprot:CAMPEP_0184643486 /NCGR_PEP_ID=MMETSP0308-20130426/342_1 /TAXON_ID=38269 /ORGANISM="Gloeochaete witrockiana, Strain SAG 46.84" /LENGTH=235 /DNA_ID=CAMNT_0027071463 /DNA_START=46 /DNA_END=753 /DNA_ORIENTATION=+
MATETKAPADVTIGFGASPPPPPIGDDAVASGGVMGKAKGYLSQKGYAWLLDVEDDDDFGEEGGPKPLLEELEIDFNDIFLKARCVLVPTKANREVLSTQADFWGPLFVVLAYALLLLWNQFKVVSWIITLWIIGSLLISILARVLGAEEASFSRTLGVIGYSLVPLVIVSVLLILVGWIPVIPFILKAAGTGWATYAAGSILVSNVPDLDRKRPLVMYPIFLLYIYFMSLHAGV